MKKYIFFLLLLCFQTSLSAQLSYLLTVDGGNVFNHEGDILTECAMDVDYSISGVVLNTGTTEITSFDIMVDSINTYSFTSNIGVDEVYRYEIPALLNTGTVLNVHTVDLINVNGSPEPDETLENNTAKILFDPVFIDEERGILLEDLTGIWCGACPRGTVYTEEIAKRFGKHVVAVAAHSGDPIAREDHVTGLFNNTGAVGFPTLIVDRKIDDDPFLIIDDVIDALQVPPIAEIKLGGELDGVFLNPFMKVTFKEDIQNGNFNVAAIITEDNIINDDISEFDQANAYGMAAFTDAFHLGGFGYFPQNVKSSWWPYSHVSRLLIGGYDGLNALTGDFTAGEEIIIEFGLHPVNGTWNVDNLKAAVIIMDSVTGEVLNATSVKYSEVLTNGNFDTTSSTSSPLVSNAMNIYPNPTHERTNLFFELDQSSDLLINICDVKGQNYLSTEIIGTGGKNHFSINVSDFPAGIYLAKVISHNRIQSKKFVVAN